MSDAAAVKIKIPWPVIFGLGPHIVDRTPTSVDAFTARICEGIHPPPLIEGLENLPANPCFVLAANHYQRRGLWILFPAAVMTQIIRRRYGALDPPVRWMVTANWPAWRFGPWQMASPGDRLLPRVADALACYPVSFAGTNQGYTARSIRKILREAPNAGRPLGIFPEGVGGTADGFAEPIPGVGRLLSHLAKLAMPVMPVRIGEARGQLIFRLGEVLSTAAIAGASDAGTLVMDAIRGLNVAG